MEAIQKLGSQSAVVIFSKSTCCMCHAIKRLFYDQGVSPAVYELDEPLLDVVVGAKKDEIERALTRLAGGGKSPIVPAVFVGGKFVGSTNHVLTCHLDGSLNRMLKDAGALWL